MSIDRLGNELAALGVAGRDVRCLLLLPQIYVGWAGQRRDLPALEALLDTTIRRVRLPSDILPLARGWLFEQPTRAQFQSGFALLRALRRSPDQPLIESSDVLQAMLWACRAARLDRDPPASRGGRTLVAPAVASALGDLEEWLEVDIGELRADLLDHDPEPPRLVVRAVQPSLPGDSDTSAPVPPFGELSDAELEQATAVLPIVPGEPRERDESTGSEQPNAHPPPPVVLFDDHDDGAYGPASAPFPLLRKLG